jgi:hypothetical protein
MVHTIIVMRQYLATAVLIVTGLIASGCGDSATVNPVVELASLSVNPGTLQPAFSGGTTSYRVDLTSDRATVTVTAQPAVFGDTVTIDGQATTSRTITLDPPGETTVVNIVVSESTTSSRTYTVRLVRADRAGNNSLANLTVSPGTPPLAFNANTLNYSVAVGNTVNSVTVTPTLQDPLATMTVNGQATTSGQGRTITPLSPAGQSTTITIVVTAQNGTEKSYTIAVSRGVSNNNNLSALTVSPGSLDSAFTVNDTSYTVNLVASLPSNVTSVRVTPTLQDTTARMTVNGQAATSGQAQTASLPQAGSNTFFNIVVTAQNGTQKTYTVNFVRAALGGNNNLSALTVGLSTSSPNLISFSPNTTSYTVDVGSGVGTITVTPTLQDPAATLTVTSNGPGPITTSGQARTIPLRAAGLSTTINIVVRAQNGSEKPYTITLDRASPPPPSGNNNLSTLSVRVGNTGQTLSPTFDSNTTAYTVNVGSAVTSVTVAATLQDTAASMTINGQGTSSGVPSAPITLGEPESSTDIPIVVTAPNGVSKSYTITVKKRPSAPDLIPEDDSGLLPGQDSDNITNVTTPRFRIPQPEAGETLSLYVDGSQVASEFDQGANTLKPTAPLSDGLHSISYTVTNSASLVSPQSDPLEVTIDTVAPVR